MRFTITAPAFLPSVEYFIYLLNCNYVLFADHFQYVKRSSINRSFPLNNNNYLTIPIKHTGGISTIKNKEIAQDNYWQSNHLKTIRHQYNAYPFFDEYYFEIATLYEKSNHSLADFLSDTVSFFLSKLKINTILESTHKLNFLTNLSADISNYSKTTSIFEFIYKQAYEGNKWINISKIKSSQISTISIKMITQNSLLSISILDLLFNFGPEAPFKIRDLYRSCFVLN